MVFVDGPDEKLLVISLRPKYLNSRFKNLHLYYGARAVQGDQVGIPPQMLLQAGAQVQ